MNQKLDFTLQNKTVTEALNQLSAQSGTPIAYSKQFFSDKKSISLSFQQVPLEAILDAILQSYPIDFKVQGKRILLFRIKKDRYILSGYLRDQDSQERLIGATVYSSELDLGTITNEYGFYSLSLPPGNRALEYRYLGYEPKRVSFNMDQDQRRNVNIEASTTLQEVLVVAGTGVDQSLSFEHSRNSNYELSKDFLQNVPGLGGEKDILRAAQLLPGIQSGSDGLGGIQVRGSDNGHNLMLMDGVPVYIPFHLMGALSVYNAHTVQSAKVLKGSFPARYGGRLSSVFDIHTRDGNKNEWSFQTGANFLNTQAVVEGPIIPGKSSILIAARYLPIDILLSPSFSRMFFNDNNEELNFNFYDLNVKWNWAISDRDQLFLSVFQGKDDFFGNTQTEEVDKYEFSLGWQNQILALRWNHVFSGQLFSNLTLTRSLYEFDYSSLSEFEDEEEEFTEIAFYGNASRNQDWALKWDLDYLVNPQHQLRFGAGISTKTFEPESVFFDEDEEFIEDLDTFNIEAFEAFYEIDLIEALEGYAYLEDNWQLNSSWQLQTGLRLSAFTQDESFYLNWEPRISSQYQFGKDVSLKASYSRMVQYLHLISSGALRLPNDIWLPSSDNTLPQSADLFELGLHFPFSKKLNFSMETYYRSMDNLYTYPELGILQTEPSDEFSDDFLKGEGENYGIEWTLQKRGTDFGGWLNYTLAWSNRRFAEENFDMAYPSIFDQRHQFKSFLYYQKSEQLRFSLNLIYNSPTPLSAVVNFADNLDGSFLLDPNPEGERNLLRSTAYHRVDFNIHYNIRKNKLEHRFDLGIYNLLNRKNITFYNLVFTDEDSDAFVLEPVTGMPILPSFSYLLKF
ncbi:MAG: TonB-dependent receptor [Bacteroidota bacterium]